MHNSGFQSTHGATTEQEGPMLRQFNNNIIINLEE